MLSGESAPVFRTDAIATAVQSFLDSLDEEQTIMATLPMDTDERAMWSNLPVIMVLEDLLHQMETQDAAAKDVFEGPGRRKSLEGFEGLSIKDLAQEQAHLLHRLVAEYLHNADHDAAHESLSHTIDRTQTTITLSSATQATNTVKIDLEGTTRKVTRAWLKQWKMHDGMPKLDQ